ncbi:MAG: peptidase S8 [Alphaproteobacteria bacterium]|nr:peptidase S8 [Alphaproteobacteria bacterium]MBM3623896.1 peptidase S8 [Alphaproteobacteria bacterium]MBM3640563.1 peptidase S8 [Alphaproteobacteria bacterium]
MVKYAILRNLAATRTASPFESIGPTISAASPPEPQVDIVKADPKDVVEIVKDPQVQALAPVMPTSLIRPVEIAASAAAPGDAWGVAAVKADASSCTGDGVIVSVLDTGIDRAHPAFSGVEIVEEDFSGSGNGDRQGHGSHCAGTIFGRDVDGKRIGIARGVKKALIGKVLADNGSGDSDMIFRGIQWAIDRGAHVISMSLGFDFPGLVKRLTDAGWPVELATSNALEAYRANLRMFDALMRMSVAMAAFRPGTVLVAAAGNESRVNENPDFKIAASLPAAAEGVVSVGALQQQADGKLSIAYFSNTFPQIAAPGVNILSVKVGGGLRALNGTSMACPHVAGVAALWWEALRKSGVVNPSAQLVMARMLASARTDGFASGVVIADRGVGLVTSPP